MNISFSPSNLFKLIILISLISLSAEAQTNYDSMQKGFSVPPSSARPRTWWHWTNSNVSVEGITKDLEWMKKTGIGGMQLADVAAGQGQVTEKKTLFRSPEWLEAVRHTASEADRLGLEMAVFSSAGWSLAGGPWVKPEQAMKKLVWSEITVQGPLSFTGKLPDPPACEGPIRDLSRTGRKDPSEIPFYRDCVVLAFPTPEDDLRKQVPEPLITTGGGETDIEALLDDDLNTSARIIAGKDKNMVWIQFQWEKPYKVQAVTLASRAGIPFGCLKASRDGKEYKTIALFPGPQLYRSGKVATFSVPETSAEYFRFEFTGAPRTPAEVMAETVTKADSVYIFSEIKLHSSARINRWEDKAGFYHLFNYEPVASEPVLNTSVIDPAKIVDITGFLLPDGTVGWKVPEGNWTIMRFGYSLTGARNRPAVPAGLGYEVDKLSREHTESYLKEYIRPVRDALGSLYGKSLRYILLDSWEAGMQNWTDKMTEEFKNRRGYDMTSYLPCLTGRIVAESDQSDRFLWDFRRTLADMFAENFYKVVTDFFNKEGIGTYGEASGVSLEILEDALLCKKYVDIPMGEFWYRALHPELMYYQDVRGAASAAHIYGKPVVAAEAFTGGGFNSPYELKIVGDYWFTQGINRFVFHTSAHQPLDTKPGNTMVGTHINRNITWADQAEPFMTYLSRCSFLLQQGKFAADLAYLLDEGAPSTMPIWGEGLKPAPPEGYDYDYVNADALINRMSVDNDGRLILPDGMSYTMLVLPETRKMTLHVLRKIHDLVREGATVVGPRPESTPGLSGYPGSEETLKALSYELWGDLDGVSRTKREFGKGNIFWGISPETVLKLKKTEPDLEYSGTPDTAIDWIHRKTEDADIYMIVNSTDNPVKTEIRFRQKGRTPEIWDPATGGIRPVTFEASGERTVIPLSLAERESFFVVFTDKVPEKLIAAPAEPVLLADISENWEVSFSPEYGGPEKAVFSRPESWTLNSDERIKYYSGTATYTKTIKAPEKWFKAGNSLKLDLGDVRDVAEISVNGRDARKIWKPPYTADITGLLKKGSNNIEIRVTNQWTNRLAGDRNLPPEKKVLNSSLFVFPRAKLNDSGLPGPVRILSN